jgi:RNA polymerase sigma-70 factor, ECF subfamily
MKKLYARLFAASLHDAQGNRFLSHKEKTHKEIPMFAQNALVAETVKLQRFALRLTKNKPDADDLLQATCLRALEKSHLFNEGTNLFSWTSRIMFHIFVSGWRRRTQFETQYDPETYIEKMFVGPSQDTTMEVADLEEAMKKLGSEHRDILIAVCVKGMRYKEVAEELDIPLGTVRSRLSRAREQLQIIMNAPPPHVVTQAISVKKPVNTNVPRIPGYIAAAALQKRVHI